MHSMNELFTKVDENKKAMLETWRMLVDRDCGSANKAGVDAVGKDIQHFLEALGFAVRFIPTKRREICLSQSTAI